MCFTWLEWSRQWVYGALLVFDCCWCWCETVVLVWDHGISCRPCRCHLQIGSRSRWREFHPVLPQEPCFLVGCAGGCELSVLPDHPQQQGRDVVCQWSCPCWAGSCCSGTWIVMQLCRSGSSHGMEQTCWLETLPVGVSVTSIRDNIPWNLAWADTTWR